MQLDSLVVEWHGRSHAAPIAWLELRVSDRAVGMARYQIAVRPPSWAIIDARSSPSACT
jgi:hypothetical protein